MTVDEAVLLGVQLLQSPSEPTAALFNSSRPVASTERAKQMSVLSESQCDRNLTYPHQDLSHDWGALPTVRSLTYTENRGKGQVWRLSQHGRLLHFIFKNIFTFVYLTCRGCVRVWGCTCHSMCVVWSKDNFPEQFSSIMWVLRINFKSSASALTYWVVSSIPDFISFYMMALIIKYLWVPWQGKYNILMRYKSRQCDVHINSTAQPSVFRVLNNLKMSLWIRLSYSPVFWNK